MTPIWGQFTAPIHTRPAGEPGAHVYTRGDGRS